VPGRSRQKTPVFTPSDQTQDRRILAANLPSDGRKLRERAPIAGWPVHGNHLDTHTFYRPRHRLICPGSSTMVPYVESFPCVTTERSGLSFWRSSMLAVRRAVEACCPSWRRSTSDAQRAVRVRCWPIVSGMPEGILCVRLTISGWNMLLGGLSSVSVGRPGLDHLHFRTSGFCWPQRFAECSASLSIRAVVNPTSHFAGSMILPVDADRQRRLAHDYPRAEKLVSRHRRIA